MSEALYTTIKCALFTFVAHFVLVSHKILGDRLSEVTAYVTTTTATHCGGFFILIVILIMILLLLLLLLLLFKTLLSVSLNLSSFSTSSFSSTYLTFLLLILFPHHLRPNNNIILSFSVSPSSCFACLSS